MVIDGLRVELTGAPGFNTAHITEHRDGGDYWLTVLNCGWHAAYRRLHEREVKEYAAAYERPSLQVGFYVADLLPVNPLGPSAGP
jgi:hypothetical protein